MSPLFHFLASSLNVELVYIILKGITKFSKIMCVKSNRYKIKSGFEFIKEIDGNLVLKLTKIKI